MTSIELYNNSPEPLDKATVKKILLLAKKEGQANLYSRLERALKAAKGKNAQFIKGSLAIEEPPQEILDEELLVGLGAARHSGIAKEALDECGRLKKGYKFENGKIVKVKAKAKKATTKKTKAQIEKEKLREKVLKLKELIKDKDLPKITKGLNGAYLADGHEILTDYEIDQLGEEEYLSGLNAAAKDVEAIVNELILDKLKTGEDLPPWKQSWATKTNIPAQNFVTKKPYSGSNSIILNVLLASIMPTPYYLTFKQVQSLGGKVKEGAKSVPLVYYNFVHNLKNLEDQPEKESELLAKLAGKEFKRKGKKITLTRDNYAHFAVTEKDIEYLGLERDEYISKGFLLYYRVFNIADTTGIEYEVPKGYQKTPKERIDTAEAIVKSFTDKPKLKIDDEKAYYKLDEDTIWTPDIDSFDTAEEYYSTLFHELVHSTMHENRLNRKKDYEKKDNKAQYAFEELIAELGASYLCGLSGILEVVHINQASYLKGWHEKLTKLAGENPNFFVYATREAQKAVDYIIRNYDSDKKSTKKSEKYDAKTKALAKAKALKLKLKLKLKA